MSAWEATKLDAFANLFSNCVINVPNKGLLIDEMNLDLYGGWQISKVKRNATAVVLSFAQTKAVI